MTGRQYVANEDHAVRLTDCEAAYIIEQIHTLSVDLWKVKV